MWAGVQREDLRNSEFMINVIKSSTGSSNFVLSFGAQTLHLSQVTSASIKVVGSLLQSSGSRDLFQFNNLFKNWDIQL